MQSRDEPLEVNRIGNVLWEIPRHGNMKVPARIYGDEQILEAGKADRSILQAAHVAELPGVVGYSLAMPDIHWGYGFPIGGVAATDVASGVVSPGGVGYDINCGVRLVAMDLEEKDVRACLDDLVHHVYRQVPCGIGSSGGIPRIAGRAFSEVCRKGSRWAVKKGYGSESDLERTEDGGCLEGADPDRVSQRAVKRGLEQVGTLGSGNHFLELGVVDKIYDPKVAGVFGLEKGQVTLMIHTGSRGFGYQVCDDFLKGMVQASQKFGIRLPDRQLACSPLDSTEGKNYLAAMACAANFAWANRQVIMVLAARAFEACFQVSSDRLKVRLIYDVSHNMAKIEKHVWKGREMELCVHRKGATRAFGPGHPKVPLPYRAVGQPVLIPGDMGTASYVCVGTQQAMEKTFGSTCHGAGRVMSRHQAKKAAKGRMLEEELRKKGVAVLSRGRSTLAEEMPEAYKDIHQVVQVMHEAGISMKVARLRPVGVIKG